jgi:hypothetical protein
MIEGRLMMEPPGMNDFPGGSLLLEPKTGDDRA